MALGHIHDLLYGVFCAHVVSMAVTRYYGVFKLPKFKTVFRYPTQSAPSRLMFIATKRVYFHYCNAKQIFLQQDEL